MYSKGGDKHIKKIVKEATEEGNKNLKAQIAALSLDNVNIRKEIKDNHQIQQRRDRNSMIIKILIFIIMLLQTPFIKNLLFNVIPAGTLEVIVNILKFTVEVFN